MQAFLVVSVLAVSVSFGDSINGEVTEVPTATQILDAWARRASSFKSGKISWTVPVESWNLFGRFETDWVHDSTPAGQEITGTLSFTAQSARYDSFSVSYTDFGESLARRTTTLGFYKRSLSWNFLLRTNEYRELLPYTVIFSPEDRLHFWHGNENEYPRAIILPAVSEDFQSLTDSTCVHKLEFTAHSSGPSSILHQFLVAPALLTFRPLLYDRGLIQEGTLLDVDELQPTYAGRPCVVLRVRYATEVVPTNETETSHKKDPKNPPDRVYWVDPSRDFVVVRCIDMRMRTNGFFYQIDIHYNRIADIGWIPNTWTALRFKSPTGPVQQIVMALRTDIDTGQSISDAWMKMTFPPRTGVINTLKDQRYIVRDDLSKYEFPKELLNMYTHAEIMAMSTQGHRKNPMSPGKARRGKARRILVGLFNWPGVLIPVSLIFVILIVINGRLVRRRNPCPASGEPQMDPPDSR